MSNHFKGRTIATINDLSLDEMAYLFDKAREIKLGFNDPENHVEVPHPDSITAYLVFFENSTRTKESFWNAAQALNIKVRDFNAGTSSRKKGESLVDTFQTLAGYSPYTIFIVRSPEEGVCRAMEAPLAEFAQRNGLEKPAFINAGDGQHEHPTQELLDEFTFYEQLGNRKQIHIALVGDLKHGRTTHSKADGLRFFDEVEVDLIAPDDLQMPPEYQNKMLKNGFRVKKYPSLEKYLAQDNIANVLYFTRLQLERMEDETKSKAAELSVAITMNQYLLGKIPKGTKLYHPLPLSENAPVLPSFLVKTPYMGWEQQFMNGLFTRTALLGMLCGAFLEECRGEKKTSEEFTPGDQCPNPRCVSANTTEGIPPLYEMGECIYCGSRK